MEGIEDVLDIDDDELEGVDNAVAAIDPLGKNLARDPLKQAHNHSPKEDSGMRNVNDKFQGPNSWLNRNWGKEYGETE